MSLPVAHYGAYSQRIKKRRRIIAFACVVALLVVICLLQFRQKPRQQTVNHVATDSFSLDAVPAYSGSPSIVINDY